MTRRALPRDASSSFARRLTSRSARRRHCPARMAPDDVIARAEAYVKRELVTVDGSHDWWHVARVRATAVSLAREEGDCDVLVVELAALLHDVKDWKYSGDEDAGANAARAWLTSEGGVSDDVIDAVCEIVRGIGFKTELAGGDAPRSKEFMVVQDADRLDAIGAIGIGRTFCFGGSRNSPMHVPGVEPLVDLTAERYKAMRDDTTRPNTVINHFYEKLFKLKGMMKTESGRRRAGRRHDAMVEFVERFLAEWDGVD